LPLALSEARDNYERLGLDTQRVIQVGNEVRVLPWRGDAVNDTLAMWLGMLGLPATNEGLSVVLFGAERPRVIDALQDISELPLPKPEDLASLASNLIEEKWDWLLPEHLLRKGFGLRHFDVAVAQKACREMIASEP
jgi:ATP-dependent Lhr-like helicase